MTHILGRDRDISFFKGDLSCESLCWSLSVIFSFLDVEFVDSCIFYKCLRPHLQENNLDNFVCCKSEAGPALRSSDLSHQDLILFYKISQ